MSKEIAKTNKPVVPVLYSEAVARLEECQNIDEAKHFTDAAEALAVWAKIYKENDAGRQARQLRLHAFRRMALIARELVPRQGKPGGGSEPGPVALLRKHGLSRHQADAANHLAKIERKEFDGFVGEDVPPAPTTIASRHRRAETLTPWRMLVARPRTPFSCAGYIKSHNPEKLARSMSGEEAEQARYLADNLIRWLQAFSRSLPKR